MEILCMYEDINILTDYNKLSIKLSGDNAILENERLVITVRDNFAAIKLSG